MDFYELLRNLAGTGGATAVAGGGLWLWVHHLRVQKAQLYDLRDTYQTMLTDTEARRAESEARCAAELKQQAEWFGDQLKRQEDRAAEQIERMDRRLTACEGALDAALGRLRQYETQARDRQAPGTA